MRETGRHSIQARVLSFVIYKPVLVNDLPSLDPKKLEEKAKETLSQGGWYVSTSPAQYNSCTE